ncbi:MAG TPA: ABC transporter ATP-binding protein, partial [Opitutales bacterium]|nr:ABC transporter ATP-binding protein [Opitutales bacterium]
LLLARIFVQESNLLVLDEPTNDLDIETLELLEDLLFQYQGTLLLVSHDREFLNRIATQTYAIEGNGRIRETVGGYDEYFRDKRLEEEAIAARQSRQTTRDKPAPSKSAKPRTRTRKETQELEAIPSRIEELEKRQSILIGEMSQVGFGSDAQRALQVKEELETIEQSLSTCFARWEALEAIPES